MWSTSSARTAPTGAVDAGQPDDRGRWRRPTRSSTTRAITDNGNVVRSFTSEPVRLRYRPLTNPTSTSGTCPPASPPSPPRHGDRGLRLRPLRQRPFIAFIHRRRPDRLRRERPIETLPARPAHRRDPRSCPEDRPDRAGQRPVDDSVHQRRRALGRRPTRSRPTSSPGFIRQQRRIQRRLRPGHEHQDTSYLVSSAGILVDDRLRRKQLRTGHRRHPGPARLRVGRVPSYCHQRGATRDRYVRPTRPSTARPMSSRSSEIAFQSTAEVNADSRASNAGISNDGQVVTFSSDAGQPRSRSRLLRGLPP